MKCPRPISFVEFPKEEVEQSIPSRFERIVARHADRVAIHARNCSLTYRELHELSSCVARTILECCGNGPEPIPLLLDHGAAVVVAILGVLKAGKFYVPLDPSHPKARNRYIVRDTAARAVITNNRNHALAADLVGDTVHLLNIDSTEPADEIRGQTCRADTASTRLLSATPDSLAYVIYTSGSTGQPKGVMQNHRNVLHRAMAYTNSGGICADDRLALLYSCSSSGSVRDIFTALLNGAMLAPFDIRQESWERLAAWLAEEQITVCNSAATIFRHFAGALQEEQSLPKLRLIHVGSETIYKKDVELYKSRFSPECIFVARLGSTEISPVREYPINKETVIAGNTVPAGFAIDETEVVLIDEDGHDAGFNTVGEIAVRSRYLFPGYWQRANLTSAVLTPDPKHSGQRIFRTGDLGRLRPDGCLEYIGRKDFQVKIRGHRVEIEEIEVALLGFPAIEQAVVTVRSDHAREPQLVAYLRMKTNATGTDEIRRAMAKLLPAYMIPSAFVVLDSFPVLPNGKVNRRALLQSEFSPGFTTNDEFKPDTVSEDPLESALVKIWSQTLRTDVVDTRTSFFDLGGDSLLAMQVVSGIRRVLRLDLPVKTLFQHSSVSELAAAIVDEASDTARIHEIQERACAFARLSGEPSTFRDDSLAPITARRGTGPVPLSLTQEQLWFIDQLSPGNPTYNMAHAFRLQGTLKPAAVQRSVNEIVRRHQALRTTFTAIDGVPVQVINPNLEVTVPIIDLTRLPQSERMPEASRRMADEARQPYSLAEGPLLRCSLLKLDDRDHIFLVCMHHIISDGWSWGVFLKEVAALYDAFAADRPSPLNDLPIQYTDFVEWQHEWLRGEKLESRLAYWRKQLEGAPAQLALPADYPRRTVQTFRGATETVVFRKDLTEKLKDLSRSEGATFFMTLLAAFNTLLFRWTGQEDIVVGSSIAGRNRTELEGLIGLFINTLAVRTDASGNPTFRELLGRVREVALGAYANQEVPFEKLNEKLRANRSLSKATLFQVLFILNQNEWQHDLKLSGLDVSSVSVELGTAKFDLFLSVIEKADGLSCSANYRTDLFTSLTIQRMLRHFETLLEGVVSDPGARLSSLPLLTEQERSDLLVRWNDTQQLYPSEKCIHDLFEEQVERTPNATAVVFQQDQLRYFELDARANQLAHYLRLLGVQPGGIVCICMERSTDVVVAILGVLKAGAAYVPVDPKYTMERLPWILTETEAPVLLTHHRTAEFLPDTAARVVCLDSDWEIISSEPIERPAVATNPKHLAYIIYTSGSTGQPKGVEITHRSLVNFATSTCATFDLKPTDRVLQFASISFDTAAEEIFPCLIQGATLVLRTESMLDSASRFFQCCRDLKVTILDLPTAYWDELTEAIASDCLTLPESLRLVVLGGEKAIPERVAQWQKHVRHHVRLLNTYGPTEATVVATTQELCRPSGGNTLVREVPIGRPIANTRTYMLDRHLNPVPIGACGELYIGGTGLSRGYHKRPDLTAEKFVPNPFSNKPGDRLYKTGDLARYLADGTIEFVGRADFQVKIRGFRIEPGEIETVLSEHPMVRQTAVLALDDAVGGKRLVAYVVVSTNSPDPESELRGFLKRRLPDYMIPAAVVFLDAFPHTVSGKIDRQALPAPAQNRIQSENAVVGSRTPLEHQIVREWEELLGVHPIGIKDNFFDLGGHSLLAIRLVARIEKSLSKSVPVATLFQSPTIEQLALTLEHSKSPKSGLSLTPIQPKGSRLPFFWIHGDFSNAVLSRYLGPDQPLYGLVHQGEDGQVIVNTRVETIAAQYLKEIRTVQPHGPYFLGGYSFGAVAAFEIAHQLLKTGERVGLLFLLDPPCRVARKSQPPTVSEQIQSIWDKLQPLGVLEKLAFVATRLKPYFGETVQNSRITKVLKDLLCKAYLAIGYPLPASMRSRYILNVYRDALRSYMPQRYPDSANLFRGPDRSYDPRFDWPNLFAGGLEIYEGSGDHMDMKKEPFIVQWAMRLKECLDRAQESSGAPAA